MKTINTTKSRYYLFVTYIYTIIYLLILLIYSSSNNYDHNKELSNKKNKAKDNPSIPMKKLKRNPNSKESTCYKSSDEISDLNNDESQQQNV